MRNWRPVWSVTWRVSLSAGLGFSDDGNGRHAAIRQRHSKASQQSGLRLFLEKFTADTEKPSPFCPHSKYLTGGDG
jgi:hypothetical protein